MNDRATRLVESFYADIWNRHDKSAIPKLLCADFTFRGSLGPSKVGHEEFAGYVDFVHDALGDYRCDIQDLVVSDHKAFAKMLFSGIHRKNFLGYEPTSLRVEWAGAALFTFRGADCGSFGAGRFTWTTSTARTKSQDLDRYDRTT